jgi:hypothetical protein
VAAETDQAFVRLTLERLLQQREDIALAVVFRPQGVEFAVLMHMAL